MEPIPGNEFLDCEIRDCTSYSVVGVLKACVRLDKDIKDIRSSGGEVVTGRLCRRMLLVNSVFQVSSIALSYCQYV